MVGGWRGGTGGGAGLHIAPRHQDVCRSDADWGPWPSAACEASWSETLRVALGETQPSGSSGTESLGVAGARPGASATPGSRGGTCLDRGRRGAAGRWWRGGVYAHIWAWFRYVTVMYGHNLHIWAWFRDVTVMYGHNLHIWVWFRDVTVMYRHNPHIWAWFCDVTVMYGHKDFPQ